MYHSCHRALFRRRGDLPSLKVVNFTDVLAEALGRGGHPDYYQPLQARRGDDDEAVAAARKWLLQDNGVQVDENAVKSLTADIFNETGLGGPREAFVEAFTALAREG
jgi:hypothetical protein